MFFGYRVAPFDAVYLIHDYHTFRHGRGGASQKLQRGADLLMFLALVTLQASQTCKHIPPFSETGR